MSAIRVAACQFDPSIGEVDRNLEHIERLLTDAAGAGHGNAALHSFIFAFLISL